MTIFQVEMEMNSAQHAEPSISSLIYLSLNTSVNIKQIIMLSVSLLFLKLLRLNVKNFSVGFVTNIPDQLPWL